MNKTTVSSVPSVRSSPGPIFSYVALLVLFSAATYALIIPTHHGTGMTFRVLMWCPAAAALATCALFRIDVATIGWSWRPWRWEGLGYVLPVIYAIPVYVGTWIAIKGSFSSRPFIESMVAAFGFSRWPLLGTWLVGLPLLLTIGVLSSLASTLGEEIGWRGFLLPQLTTRYGYTAACLVTGAIWAMWHYPALLWAGYNAGTPVAFAMVCFTVMVFAISFVLGWLRLRSRSVWPCAMLHASHNLIIQAILDVLTAPTGKARYITTEFGAGLVITTVVMAIYFWRRRAEVTVSPEALT